MSYTEMLTSFGNIGRRESGGGIDFLLCAVAQTEKGQLFRAGQSQMNNTLGILKTISVSDNTEKKGAGSA